jgi:hypothetical protein
MLRSNASRSTAHIWTAELWREASPEELAEQQALAAELKAAGKTHPDAPVFAKPEYVDEDDIRRKVVVPGQRSIVKSLALPGYVMVAGDLGCSVGGSYCSMTGWRDLSEDGAGTYVSMPSFLCIILGSIFADSHSHSLHAHHHLFFMCPAACCSRRWAGTSPRAALTSGTSA